MIKSRHGKYILSFFKYSSVIKGRNIIFVRREIGDKVSTPEGVVRPKVQGDGRDNDT